MLINISDILSHENQVVQKEVVLEMEEFTFKMGTFPIIEKTPVHLILTNMGNKKLLVEGMVDLSLVIPCARCLEDVKTDMHLNISKEVDMKISDEERMKEMDETHFMLGYDLDVEKLIYGEILLNWPIKVLCKEDCLGICSICGKNLNLGKCECDTETLDPRMAAIQDVFKKFKEV
ncbi:YceD family protein [Anaerosacchariphilus polymeriproducens]|uniref:DUF177 domain-containing protein n=1 Tax=Anaerosacchariphilus polymeriproducens TaxID=1812858 RepID=A0A371ATP0_9FIRM|nr:DUF177 domain-containing protein [Anaerosacchariphilus polymeriproducens]RDU22902.1 DUF177 domain-containing protein [Anaerosacchariphilus polymeriproducens]